MFTKGSIILRQLSKTQNSIKKNVQNTVKYKNNYNNLPYEYFIKIYRWKNY